MKVHIRRYVNEKHDVTTAVDMEEAASSMEVSEGVMTNETCGTNKIKGISKINNFEFTEDGIRVWCAYQIGHGSLVSYDGMKPQEKTGMKLLRTFGAIPQIRGVLGKPLYAARAAKNLVFFCDRPGRVLTFGNESDAQTHIDTGEHELVLEREIVYDSVRRKRVQHVTKIAVRTGEPFSSTQTGTVASCSFSLTQDEDPASQGWALKGRKAVTKASENVKVFFTTKFNEGLVNG